MVYSPGRLWGNTPTPAAYPKDHRFMYDVCKFTHRYAELENSILFAMKLPQPEYPSIFSDLYCVMRYAADTPTNTTASGISCHADHMWPMKCRSLWNSPLPRQTPSPGTAHSGEESFPAGCGPIRYRCGRCSSVYYLLSKKYLVLAVLGFTVVCDCPLLLST